MNINTTSQSNAGKYVERNDDDIEAAGKCFTLSDTARECLFYPDRPRTPEKIHKFRCTTHSAPGRARIFYGRYTDPDLSSGLTHGVSTKTSFVAGNLCNPEPKSHFQYQLNEKKENSVYASHQRAPLGNSHDQRPGLPEGVNPGDERYGLQVLKEISAGQLINPPKTRVQVQEEAANGLDLYKISHSDYVVGESYNRKYDWSRIPSTSKFGIETPHDNRGKNTSKTLKWLSETQSEKAAHVTTKRNDDFRERTIPKVATVHDPIKDTLHASVTPDHTFGIMVRPDKYGAGDLIHMRESEKFLRGKDRMRGVLASIRQHLKKANYHNFQDLKTAFNYYDKDQSGTIDLEELRDVCKQFNLPIQEKLLDSLLGYCDSDADGKINYAEFSNFLNWKDKMQSGLTGSHNEKAPEEGSKEAAYEEKILLHAKQDLDEHGSPKVLKKQVDGGRQNYKTSSSDINAVVGKAGMKNKRQYGIPTIRADLPAPRIRRVGDNTNYGNDSDAYGLVNPSVYSNKGVYEKDFFQSRSQGEIRCIFDSIGVEMENDVFQALWEKAREQNASGEVSVETFRGLLDEHAAEQFQGSMETNHDTTGPSKNINVPSFYAQIDPNLTNVNKEILAA